MVIACHHTMVIACVVFIIQWSLHVWYSFGHCMCGIHYTLVIACVVFIIHWSLHEWYSLYNGHCMSGIHYTMVIACVVFIIHWSLHVWYSSYNGHCMYRLPCRGLHMVPLNDGHLVLLLHTSVNEQCTYSTAQKRLPCVLCRLYWRHM